MNFCEIYLYLFFYSHHKKTVLNYHLEFDSKKITSKRVIILKSIIVMRNG